MYIKNRIKEKIILEIREEIELANGNEIFFRGKLNNEKIVDRIEILARGNSYSVPALLKRMKKKEIMIHNHPSGDLRPSDNDIKISSIYGNMGGGSYIINNEVDNIYVVAEAHNEEKKKINIDKYFQKEGILSKKFKNYEFREEQLKMAKTIEKGLNEEEKVLIEAGTGTGKTLAYLIPALKWGLANEEKVIVSTNTINLQEQLLNKDLPIVKKVLDKEFKKVIVKGRGNYLCLRKAKNINNTDLGDFSESEMDNLQKIIDWSGRTNSGDRNEMNFQVSFKIWEKVASEGDICLRNKCPHYEKCFFMKARKQVNDADLLITNHHIYFADLSIRKETGFTTEYAVLPNYEVVIFDEAHNIEKVAKDYFSYEISKYKFNKLMNQLYNYKGERNQKSGSLPKLLVYLKEINLEKNKILELNKIFNNEIVLLHKNLYEKVNDLFIKMMLIYNKNKKETEINIRLKKDETEKIEWQSEIIERVKEIKNVYAIYLKNIAKMQKILDPEEVEDEEGIINDTYKYIERLKSFFETVDFVFELEDEAYVYWLAINPKVSNIKMIATPLQITEELSDVLYNNLDNIIFTSATLAIENSFDYFKESIGLKENVIEEIIESPFDYEKQMQVIIPTDIKLPNDPQYIDNIKGLIEELINYTMGNTFLLFTSYSMLNYLYYKIRGKLEQQGFELLVQGQYPRHRLLEIYKNSKKPVLFGTSSFWEGVDVQGEKLSSVMIIKLPFKVPSDPIVEATIEKMKKEGRNPFMNYQIPEAVIKFKQGIGRLIRSKKDKGIITILDGRVIQKRYGKKFLNSLPKNAKVISSKKDEIIKEIKRSKR